MSRQAFENWMTDEGKWPTAIEMANGNYKLSTASQSWKVWLAATATALERAAEACDGINADYTARYVASEAKGPPNLDYLDGASDGAKECAEAIRALKEKP